MPIWMSRAWQLAVEAEGLLQMWGDGSKCFLPKMNGLINLMKNFDE